MFLITWQHCCAGLPKQYDHGTPIPIDLNVSGHKQHGVFFDHAVAPPTVPLDKADRQALKDAGRARFELTHHSGGDRKRIIAEGEISVLQPSGDTET